MYSFTNLKCIIYENCLQIFAIGPTTGAAIKEAGYILSEMCEKPKPESMINMINKFIEYTVLTK